MLTDSEISKLIAENNLIEHHSPECITNVGYDLVTSKLWTNDGETSIANLNPHDSVFVGSEEIVNMPDNLAAKVYLKNSRIRMGLTLDAPVFQPGHRTRIFFRLTNVSSDIITICAGEKYAMLTFEKLDGVVNQLYDGAFTNELNYRSLGNYQNVYEKQMKQLDENKKDLDAMEKSIYGNVLTIITVFVAIFSLLSTNVTLADKVHSIKDIILYNSIVLSGISFLMTLLAHVLDTKGKWLCIIVTVILVIITGGLML